MARPSKKTDNGGAEGKCGGDLRPCRDPRTPPRPYRGSAYAANHQSRNRRQWSNPSCRAVEHLPPGRAILTFLRPVEEVTETALLAEPALTEDWLKPDEDVTWAHLQPDR